MKTNNMAQQTAIYSINNDNNFTISPPNVIIGFGNAKIHFDKQQITEYELLDVYIKLKSFLNCFDGFNL